MLQTEIYYQNLTTFQRPGDNMNKRFYDSVLRLDDLMSIGHPLDSVLKQINSLIKKPELHNYFWRNLNKIDWLPILIENGFFKVLSQKSIGNNQAYISQSFIVDYLKKAAVRYPKEIIKIIKSTNSDNDRVIWSFLEIGLQIEPSFTSKLIPQLKKWLRIKTFGSPVFDSEIVKWPRHLVDGNEIEAALKTVEILITPKIQRPQIKRDKQIDKVIGKERSKAIPVIDYYYLKEFFDDDFISIAKLKPIEISNILEHSLEKSIKIEFINSRSRSDISYIWRAAIEDHQQNYNFDDLKEILLVGLRNSLEIVTSTDVSSGSEIINRYLKHKYSIFRRLAVHLIRVNFNKYLDSAFKLCSNTKLLRSTELYHEYYLLLKEHFSDLSPSIQEEIIEAILSYNNADSNAKPQKQEKQKRYYWWERLNFLNNSLPKKYNQLFQELQNEFKEEKFRDTPVWHESYRGEKSPKPISSLESMTVSDIWNYLKSFTPIRKDFDSPSREGLAHIFCEVVKRDPERFLKEELLPLIDIHPTYSYWLINLFAEKLKEDLNSVYFKYLENILNICSRLMRIEDIPQRFTDDMGINFKGVKKRILELVQSLIKSHQKSFSLDYKDLIWEIIYYLCYYELDLDELPDNRSDMDPFTLSLNSVRGTAMHSLIDYALWYAYHTKENYGDEKRPNRFTGEERIQTLLEEKLNKQNDRSLAIHSIFGVFLPNLAYLNYSWVKDNLGKIFPIEKENQLYWETAWGSYMNAARFYTDLYKLLEPQFERAVSYLSQGKKFMTLGFGRNTEEALGEHLIVACINGLDNIKRKNSLLRKFINFADSEIIIHSIQFIANQAKDSLIFKELPDFDRKSFWPQAKEFWKIRIKVVKILLANRKRSKEDKFDTEFSRYISWLDDLPSEVTLKELEPLLIETIKINQRGWHLPNFIEFLSLQSDKYPLIAIRLFEKLMHTNAPSYFYHGKEKEIERILQNAIGRKKNEGIYFADKIVNKFGEWGNYYFKDFWISHLKDKKLVRTVKLQKRKK